MKDKEFLGISWETQGNANELHFLLKTKDMNIQTKCLEIKKNIEEALGYTWGHNQ